MTYTQEDNQRESSEEREGRESTLEDNSESDDLFNNDYINDYVSKPELDQYEVEEGEDEYIPPLTRKELEAAEEEIRMQGNTFTNTMNSEINIEDYSISEQEKDSEEQSNESVSEVPEFKILKNSLDKESVQRAIIKKMQVFFSKPKYIELIDQMASLNDSSLTIDYFELEEYCSSIAMGAISLPIKVLPLINEALNRVVKRIYPKYFQIRATVVARIVNIPTMENIRDLRNIHLNSLVRVIGIVTKRSRVFPVLSLVKYTCNGCKAVVGPFLVETELVKPNRCLECQSTGTLTINTTETIYKDYQKVSIQEVPGTVLPGRLPRSKEVILQYDLIDSVRPGDEIELVGIYKNNYTLSRSSTPTFYTSIEALSLVKRGDDSQLYNITAEDEKEIKRLSKQENILSLIINSIAPSIHGEYQAKRGIALALFGGVHKHSSNMHRVRGDINVLLLGDPGMGKSQLLKYTQNISHKAVFATGQGASAVGLTAMVRKDPISREWSLEGGALVLADKGVCLIDEFDKMKDTDRVSIHEAMEQQSISISKAGIVTSLQARCAVIAAANPIRGRYNSTYTFSQNVNLSDPIISRFDIISVVKDPQNIQYDKELASFIVESHKKRISKKTPAEEKENPTGEIPSESKTEDTSTIPQALLRKYISYARERIAPTIEAIDTERLSSLYTQLRKESVSVGSMPITVRHIESIVRISEASARMHLRSIVTKKDIDLAIRVVLDSFCGTQKNAVKFSLIKKFQKYLPSTKEDTSSAYSLLNSIFTRLPPGTSLYPLKEFKKKATSLGIPHKDLFLSKEFQSVYSITESGYITQKNTQENSTNAS
ncbi:DNA replication licensing factor MCM2 [Nematocida sp. AWRm80]|nr:DNA replication licensing factor MCM2 [Nematocida sp. AWRm80]